MLTKVVVIYSGGMDSYTLLKQLQQDPTLVIYAISVDYGQRHSLELKYAARVCAIEGIPHKIVDLSPLRDTLAASALTSDAEVPHGHYEDASMKKTVVPNRNAILIMIAAGYAVSIGADSLYIGVHAGDHAIYPDCRPEFIDAMHNVLQIANYDSISLHAPYLHSNKIEIADIGSDLSLDYGMAWTCYDPQEEVKACGKCGACQERLEAMKLSGAVDTMEYTA